MEITRLGFLTLFLGPQAGWGAHVSSVPRMVPRVRQAITTADWFAINNLKDAYFTMRQQELRILDYLVNWLVCAFLEEQCRFHVALLLEHIQVCA